jgi:drug/metabolite transporter (DMT)-like permease
VWLVLATVLWGASFPIIKTILLRQQALVPDTGSAFFAALMAAIRFGVAGLIMALACMRTLRTLTRKEFQQGVTLAFFGGMGILLQMDGLAHTAASTSAFLTQFYCLLLPVWVAVKSRSTPGIPVIISSVLVLTGAAILSGVDFQTFTIKRGELETILAAVFFAGQILCLDNPKYAQNRTGNFTVIMFALTALLNLPVAVALAPGANAFAKCYADASVITMMTVLVLVCTIAAYMLMNAWQRFVTPTQAGIIYCLEPVAASAFALFMPALLSSFASVSYANEGLTTKLVSGGILILLANILIQLKAPAQK